MLIPDLLNILFDQSCYYDLVALRSLSKRRTNYANKYSLLRYYGFSCTGENIKIMKYMFETGIVDYNANQQYFDNDNNICVLLLCVRHGNFETVKYLMKNGVDVHISENSFVRHSACYGHLGMVKYLMSIGADVHAINDCALGWSAERGHLETVKYLVSIGANVNIDCYALGWSAFRGHLEVVKYLISVGADIHVNEDFALRMSAQNGRLEIVKYLVSVGANIHVNGDELFSIKMISDNF